MSFKKYLTECLQRYKYPVRIKTVVPITQVMYQLIQSHLYKYRPEYISEVKKTIFQKNPLHFNHIEGSEIWYIDALLTIPVSSYILAEELKVVLKIPDENIVVVTYYDAQEQINDYVAGIIELEKRAQEEGLTKGPRLSVSSYYDKNETVLSSDVLAGNKYNETFKKYLSTIQASRPDPTYKDEGNKPLFGWLWNKKNDPSYGDRDFNSYIEDSPKVYPAGSVKADDNDLKKLNSIDYKYKGRHGEFYTNRSVSLPFRNPITGQRIEFASMPPSANNLKKKEK